MKFTHAISTALEAVQNHKTRSSLTILGIVIGITAIMIVMSIGANAEQVIVGELGGLGAETIVIRPGKEPKGPTDIADVLLSESLKERELSAILQKSNVPDIRDAAPEVLVTGSASHGGETFRPVILGFSADFMTRVLDLKISDGTTFTEDDIKSKARVAIIGSNVRDQLFPGEDPVGKFIDIKGTKLRVVGVFAERGQVVFFNVDDLVLIPYTSAQTYLTGTKHYNQIIARVTDASLVGRATEDIKRTLRDLHNIDNPDNDDFNVETQQGLVKQVTNIIGVFTAFLSMVVAISLLVGGIGIMNIMLVSVTERTREIGLRKALGATEADILKQFLLESVMLTGIGGLIGIVLGALFSLLAAFVLSTFAGVSASFSFPVSAALLGIGVSTFVGIVFGLYPARQASRKSPMEALRYE